MIACVAANPSVDRLLEVEVLRPGEIHRPRRAAAVAGGKGLNVARAAAALGGQATALALLGGHAGRWIAEQLAAERVQARCAWRAGETRTCVSIVDQRDGRLTEFYEPGAPVTADEWRTFEALVAAELAPGVLVTLSGSLPPGAPADGWAQLARRAADIGARALLDGHGEPLLLALRERPAVVKVNAAEAQAATDLVVSGQRSALLAAQRLAWLGARAAIVTLGAAGAALVDAGGAWWVGAGPSGRYPVGSGDAFLAGLAVALDRGEPLPAACRLGAAAAAANAAVPGPGRLDLAVQERARAEIRVVPRDTTEPGAAPTLVHANQPEAQA